MGARTRFMVIDIDTDSPYHDQETVQHIRELFLARRITLHPCQSSSSGGIHLLCIFDRLISVKRLCKFAAPYLEHNDFHTGNGRLEVYPSNSTKNKVIRLPFQRGFRTLDDELIPTWSGDDNVLERSSRFLSLPSTATKEANLKPPVPRKQAGKILTANQEHLELGKYYYENGLDARGTRSMALYAISYYLFVSQGLGYDKKEERAERMLQWMRRKHNNYSSEWLKRPKAVENHIRRLAYWEPQKGKATKPKHEYDTYNQRQSADTRQRVMDAVTGLYESGEICKKNGKLNRAAVERAAKVDNETAKKYMPLIEEHLTSLKAESPM